MKCGKVCFPTYRAAMTFLHRRAWGNKRTGQAPVRAYKCARCKAWHVTSKPNRRYRS